MPTYDAIVTTTLGTAANTVTLSSIPQTFTDLFVVYKIKMASGGATNTGMRFNGNTGSNYSTAQAVYSLGGSRGWGSSTAQTAISLDNVDSTWTTITQIDINNYRNTNMKRNVLIQSAAPNSQVDFKVGSFDATTAITSITLFNFSGTNFAVGSEFTIYGILAA